MWAEFIKLSRSPNGPHREQLVQTGLVGEAFKERRKLKLVLAGQSGMPPAGPRGGFVNSWWVSLWRMRLAAARSVS